MAGRICADLLRLFVFATDARHSGAVHHGIRSWSDFPVLEGVELLSRPGRAGDEQHGGNHGEEEVEEFFHFALHLTSLRAYVLCRRLPELP